MAREKKMKSKFGVITFAAAQIKSEGIVLREPNYHALENSLRESRRRIAMGRKIIAGFFVVSATTLLAKVCFKRN
jgi:hypothetical protein